MLKVKVTTVAFSLLFCSLAYSAEFTVTMDDPNVENLPAMTPEARDKSILGALEKHKTQAALFVCGMRVNNPEGKRLLKRWNQAGHVLANHTQNHWYFHSKKVTLENFASSIGETENLLKGFSGFQKIFRFPFLKAGDTAEKRDGIRSWLDQHGYQHGYVTIDASDWYIESRLRERLKQNPDADTSAYRDFYLKHMWERAMYYDSLSKKVWKKPIKHTLLIHHNLLNALYLDDLLAFFKSKGWKLINASAAFQDPIFNERPKTLPVGESIVWNLAKAANELGLRYPAEDSKYEKSKMDKLGL